MPKSFEVGGGLRSPAPLAAVEWQPRHLRSRTARPWVSGSRSRTYIAPSGGMPPRAAGQFERRWRAASAFLRASWKSGSWASVSHGLVRSGSPRPPTRAKTKPQARKWASLRGRTRSNKRDQEHHDQDRRGDDDRADHLPVAGEVLEHLEERQEVPLGPRRVVGAGGVGGGVEVGAPLAQDQDDHDAEDRRRWRPCP